MSVRSRASSRVVLVGPLASPTLIRRVVRSPDPVIAVDGGLAPCLKARVPVALAIGDWDSLRDRRSLAAIDHVTLSPDKDESDLAAALRFARLWMPKAEILCLGVTGGDPDHHVAALLDQAFASDRGSVRALDERHEYRFLSSDAPVTRLAIPARRGERVSILSLGSSASGVTISGVKYPLSRAKLRGGSHGLGNVATGAKTGVSVERGRLVVISARKR